MAIKKGNYAIPFRADPQGVPHMLDYTSCKESETIHNPSPHWVSGHVPYDAPSEWRKNDPFDATLELVSTHRGRSSARVTVQNVQNNEQYSFGLTAFFQAIKKYGVTDNKITGRWKFQKQGSNFGLVAV